MRADYGVRNEATKTSQGAEDDAAVGEVQMAEMDATQKRVWEVGRGARGGIQEQQYTDLL